MDFPFLLLVLLALPVAVGGVIVAVSAARRRSGSSTDTADQPVHRLQAGTAAAQDAADHPAPAAPRAVSARQRRAASEVTRDHG